MISYRELERGVLLVDDSGVETIVLPRAEGWAAYLRWLANGGELQPMIVKVRPLEERRREFAARVNGKRNEKLARGFLYNGRRWDSTTAARLNLIEAIGSFNAGEPVPPGFSWRSADNEDVALSPPEFRALVRAMRVFVQACHKRAWDLKAEILASDNPEGVDTDSNWPT